MRDIGEWPAMHQRRRSGQRLHQVGRERIAQQDRHGAVRLQLPRSHGRAVAPGRDLDAAQPVLQIVQAGGEAEDGHHLARDSDVEPIFPRGAVARSAQTVDD